MSAPTPTNHIRGNRTRDIRVRGRSVRSLAVALGVALALGGCATAGTQPQTTPSSTATGEGAVTVDNCGTSVSFPSAPRRVVTIKSTSTEMMLALGLGDRIIGTAFQDGPLPRQWSTAGAKLPVLSDKVPSQEVVLNAKPDFIYAGWESNFSADGAGTRPDLAALGVGTYVSPSACEEPGYKPKKLGFQNIFDEIAEVAKVFRVSDTELLAAQRKELAAVTPDKRGLTALWYSSGSATPYVGAGIGAPELIMKTIGLRNIAAGVNDTWTSYNWETVIEQNPDVIVLVDASWNTVAHKISVLEGNPATANLDAVKNHRYLTVPFAASEAGVRTVDAAADLARQLAKLKLG